MKKYLVLLLLIIAPGKAKADFWGGDLPLLAEIVTNTLHTLYELQRQTSLMRDELRGIKDKVQRIKTISEVVQPSSWHEWKDPREAMRRLELIYFTLPKEYRSEKSDMMAAELSRAMNLIARLKPEAQTSFKSGKELERRGADASPGLAQKLTASGTGTLIALESQSLAVQSHITSLITQMLADANEKENRSVVSKGRAMTSVSHNLGENDSRFSSRVLAWVGGR